MVKLQQCNSPLYRRRFPKIDKYIYQCSNEKELCNFKTLELKYKIPIKLCPCCDGYIILKSETSNNKLLLGCTNYSMDNTGCNYTEFIDKTNNLT